MNVAVNNGNRRVSGKPKLASCPLITIFQLLLAIPLIPKFLILLRILPGKTKLLISFMTQSHQVSLPNNAYLLKIIIIQLECKMSKAHLW